jgi:hypothetical protein
VISPPRLTLSSASDEFSASLELGLGHLLHRESRGRPLRRLWHTSRDGSSNTSERLPPRSSRALTSINVAGNHDVIPRKDADAPHKQAFSPYLGPRRCYNNYGMGSPSSRGLGVWTNLGLFLGSQQGTSRHKSTIQCTVMLARRAPRYLYFEYNDSRLHCGHPCRV